VKPVLNGTWVERNPLWEIFHSLEDPLISSTYIKRNLPATGKISDFLRFLCRQDSPYCTVSQFRRPQSLYPKPENVYTVEPGYNDTSFYETLPIVSDILWYQLIPHF